MGQTLLHLAGLAVFFLAAEGSGRLLLRRLPIAFSSPGEMSVFGAATGFGVLGCMVFLLGVAGLLSPPAIWAVLAAMVLAAAVAWFVQPYTARTILESCRLPAHGVDRAAGVLLSLLVGAGLVLSLTPPVGNDTLVYHLAVPRLFLEHQGFFRIEGNIFANYPLGTEMLYLAALALGSDVPAKGIHFVFSLLVMAGMGQFMRHRLGLATGPVLSALIFFSIPSVFLTAHMAYSDVSFSLYCLLSVYAFANWVSLRQTGWLVLAGVFSGLAISTKYAGLLLPFLGALGVLWACRGQGADFRRAVFLLLVYGAGAALTGCPFLIKNTVMTGNPLFPFFYELFGGVGWDAVQSQRLDFFHRSLGMGRDVLDYLLLPWNVSLRAGMGSPRFDGVLGPVFLLTLPFSLCVRRVPVHLKIVAVYCLFTFLFWAFGIQQIRYLIPAIPFLSMITAYTYVHYSGRPVVQTLVALGIVAGLVYNGYHVVGDFQKIRPMAVVTGKESREAFYRRLVPAFEIFQYVNNRLPEDAKLFLVYMRNLGYLCHRPYYSDAIFESYTLERILNESRTPDQVHEALRNMGFSHILYDARYVFGDRSTLSPAQKARFSAFQEAYLTPVVSQADQFFLYRIDERGG